MKTIVVTGTDTEVGKTYVSCQLIRLLRKASWRVGAWKPVCSGAVRDESENLHWEDVEALVVALGGEVDREAVCPQCFEAPVAPNIAARLEKRVVDENLIRRGPVDWESAADVVIVEGAGGLVSPLSDSLSTADVAEKHGDSIVIVAANRLGVINHTLLTVEAVLARNLDIALVVLNDVRPSSTDQSTTSNYDQLVTLLPNTRILRLPHGSADFLDSSDNVADPLDALRLRREASQ